MQTTNEGTVPLYKCIQLQNGCSTWLVDSVYFSFSCSVVYFTSPPPPHVGASGHTVSLLAVTVVLVLEYSTGGEGSELTELL